MEKLKKHGALLILTAVVLLLIVGSILYFATRKNEIPAPPFTAVSYENSLCRFELPADWTLHQPDGADTDPAATEQMTFIKKGADKNVSTSNLNVNLSKVAGKQSTIKKMYEEFESSFASTVQDLYPGASDFSYSDYQAPNHKVFMVNYTIHTDQTMALCTQYYPLIKDYVLVITATDVGDAAGDEAKAIAEHIVNTFEYVKK